MSAQPTQDRRPVPAYAGTELKCLDSRLRGNGEAAAGADNNAFSRLKKFWRTFRTMVGDDAYEQYCAHHRLHHPDEPTLDRRAFYVKNQTDKWSGIKRCC